MEISLQISKLNVNIRYTFAGKCWPVQLGHKKLAKRNKETKKQTSTHTDRQLKNKETKKQRYSVKTKRPCFALA